MKRVLAVMAVECLAYSSLQQQCGLMGQMSGVSSRTKDFQGLCENVRLRSGKRSFKNRPSIRNTYQDLAGVRLTLYIPGEKSRKKAEALIKVIWPNARISRPYTKKNEMQAEESSNEGPEDGNRLQDKAHKDDGSYDYKSTHAGYQAVHYTIKSDLTAVKKASDDKTEYGYEAGDQFEIKVVSALLHSWAEAQHDVQYKTLAYGGPSKAEQRILDCASLLPRCSLESGYAPSPDRKRAFLILSSGCVYILYTPRT